MRSQNIVKKAENFKTAAFIWRAIGKTSFYARDFDLNGGEINALAAQGFIKPTGNETESFILVDSWNELYKKVSVKEWQVDITALTQFVDEVNQFCNQLTNML
jgi:hypothetical protein